MKRNSKVMRVPPEFADSLEACQREMEQAMGYRPSSSTMLKKMAPHIGDILGRKKDRRFNIGI